MQCGVCGFPLLKGNVTGNVLHQDTFNILYFQVFSHIELNTEFICVFKKHGAVSLSLSCPLNPKSANLTTAGFKVATLSFHVLHARFLFFFYYPQIK